MAEEKPDVQKHPDKEVEQFRSLMEVPDTFEDGFSWTSVMGALFISLLMVPGAIYMGLLAGEANIGPAAQWVTVILFIEVARRAHKTLKRAEIFVLFFLAGAAMSMPFSGLLWQQFFINSDAARATGISTLIPSWYAPDPSSESYSMRTFFHLDWLPVIGLVMFTTFFSQLSNMVLGYGLFRLTSDIEKLPFPMAPISAQGILALAEDADEPQEGESDQRSWRWRVFSIGGALGMVFGFFYLGVPTLTGIVLGEPVTIFPIPFADLTTKTDNFLPAVATGFAWDLGHILVGMVLPFFAMLGSFIGLVITFAANPILYHFGVLSSWMPGDKTVPTLFKNNVDFYFSFQVGIGLAIAAVGIYAVVKAVRKGFKKRDEGDFFNAPKDRGDIRPILIIGCYLFVTMTYIIVSGFLIDWHRGVMAVLFFFGFIYTPLISYVTARLEGMAGQVVEVPMVREASLILSGYKGVAVWFLPLPMANYGQMTVFYRTAELTGTRFTSIWKSTIIVMPVVLCSSILFASFIWGLAEVPSSVYPYAQTIWELEAANKTIIYSSTLGSYSIFEQAFNWTYLFSGLGFGIVLFSSLSAAGAPVFFTYGIVRGLGQSMPHVIVPQMIGALIGRYYFQKKLGLKWRQYVPVVAAGFACGQGLITTLCVGLTFLSRAVVHLPY
ncbi:MAG: peptide transporter [Puniceicoccaceae bacterium]